MARPAFKVTDEHRRLVKSMAAMGTPHEGIARKIGCNPKTLRVHFRNELDSAATEANYMVAQTLYKMAISGNCIAATIFWMKTRNRFRERDAEDSRQMAPPPFVVGCEDNSIQQQSESEQLMTTENNERERNHD
jgi:hypothetical protein